MSGKKHRSYQEFNFDIEKFKAEIVSRITPLNPEQIILFGSYADGSANKNSDVDLYIITKDDFIPKNWKERSKLYLRYSNALRSLQKTIPIDIIVHTKKMYEKLKEMNSSFYRHTICKGI